MEKLLNYIGGEHRAANDGATLPVYEPATGEHYADAPASKAADIDAAVAAAHCAKDAWARTMADERAALLHRLADAVERHMDELAEAESRDTGKPITTARKMEIPRAVANLRFFAAAATQFASETHAMEIGVLNYTLRQPLGVVGCISPWNLPLYLLTWKIAPALAAGNTVVAKPSEVTPMTAYMFSRLCEAAGVPAGVINIVHGLGPEAGQALVEHDGIDAVSFTGGTATGARIAATTAPKFRKTSLELGGKNPTVVFEDCDFERTVAETVRAGFSNTGQICLCGSRVLVQRTIYDRFRDALVAGVGELRQGDPSDPETRVGAMTSEAHRDKVLAAIEQARELGGTILTGGGPATIDGRCADGWFVEPTVIEGLPADCATNQEEIFGPVVTLMPFEDEAEAIALANGVRYGLAASVWTSDVARAHRMAAAIDAGLVWINCWMLRDLRIPMGGMKESGLGREGGFESMRFFTEAKNVTVDHR
jgi:aminomuconate-semialdehyde/2-hydroxymuconate-6-semialdehyde dehydrogenase